MSDLAELVCKAQQGSHGAFGQIVRRFQDMAFSYAYALLEDSVLAQDAAQEAFVDAYLTLEKLRDPAAFPGWFRRIVFKHSDRQMRGRKVQPTPLELANGLHAPHADPALLMEEAQLRGDVHAAINLLSAHQRAVTFLYYVEGYSQREIAEFLEVPISAVKKRLFDARRNLKERMIHMVQEQLHTTKPSQDDSFANQILFFTAVLDGDTDVVGGMVRSDDSLLLATAEWQMAIQRHYWAGATALTMAVGYGNLAMVELLLGLGADVNAQGKTYMTPLHIAVMMKRTEIVGTLLSAGAWIDAASQVGQTPLHVAAIRNSLPMVELLVVQGADVDRKDNHDRSAADWAALQDNDEIVAFLCAGGATKPDKDLPALPNVSQREWLATGIKIVDLLTPLKRGGVNGIFTAYSGVGFMVLINQIARSVQRLHGGRAIYAGLDGSHSHQENWELSLREMGADEDVGYFFADMQIDSLARQALVEEAMAAAEEIARSGSEVLIVLESKLAMSDGILSWIRESLATNPAITMLIYGHHTVEVLPESLEPLDAVLTFSMAKALARRYPAIDPVRSRSHLLASSLNGTDHAQVADASRRLLTRYEDLRFPYEAGGMETLWYIDDDTDLEADILRARRLERFLAQPFDGMEPWTGTLGEYASLGDTLHGCRAILAGEYDGLPEDVLP